MLSKLFKPTAHPEITNKTSEFEQLTNLFQTWTSRIIDLEQRIRNLELESDDFRNKVLRKVQIKENRNQNPIFKKLMR